jgi:hypothetical protein
MVNLYNLPSPAVISNPAATLLRNHALAGIPEITIVVVPAIPKVLNDGTPAVGAAGVTGVIVALPGTGAAHEKYWSVVFKFLTRYEVGFSLFVAVT